MELCTGELYSGFQNFNALAITYKKCQTFNNSEYYKQNYSILRIVGFVLTDTQILNLNTDLSQKRTQTWLNVQKVPKIALHPKWLHSYPF